MLLFFDKCMLFFEGLVLIPSLVKSKSNQSLNIVYACFFVKHFTFNDEFHMALSTDSHCVMSQKRTPLSYAHLKKHKFLLFHWCIDISVKSWLGYQIPFCLIIEQCYSHTTRCKNGHVIRWISHQNVCQYLIRG